MAYGESKLPAKVVMLVGPTASGKTDLAIALAKKFRGEVISLDSRQMYRGTAIGSATPAGRWVKRGKRRTYVVQGVPHHLLAFQSPARPLTAVTVRDRALRAVREILRRGRLPIFCGGTGLYADLIGRNFTVPEVAPDIVLRRELERRTDASLYAELRRLDPEYAARTVRQNRRYVIRALEVIRRTGRKFSEQQGQANPFFDVLWLGIKRPRATLYRRINQRVDMMMAAGLLAEASRLGRRYGWDLPTMTGVGHRQLGMHIRGEISLADAVELIKRDTRRYAKRQLTWFGRHGDIRWVNGSAAAAKFVQRFLNKTK